MRSVILLLALLLINCTSNSNEYIDEDQDIIIPEAAIVKIYLAHHPYIQIEDEHGHVIRRIEIYEGK